MQVRIWVSKSHVVSSLLLAPEMPTPASPQLCLPAGHVTQFELLSAKTRPRPSEMAANACLCTGRTLARFDCRASAFARELCARLQRLLDSIARP